MGNLEDFYYEVHETIEKNGIKKEFDNQLNKMNNQEKHKYKTTKERWEYALARITGTPIPDSSKILRL
jgi:hypothetical protein